MKKVISLLTAMIMILPLMGNNGPAKKAAPELYKNSTPPNEAGIASMLIRRGIVDKNAGQEVIDNAVSNYIRKKLTASDKTNDKAAILRELKANGIDESQYGNLLHGRKLGYDTADIDGVQEKPWEGDTGSEKLLVLLAEFGDDEDSSYGTGPLHNSIQKPLPENNADFWVSDFSKDHYKGMLFTEGGYDAVDQNGNTLHLDSMVDYYKEQSGGSFKVEGDVYGWYKLPHSEKYYGDDDPEGGNDNVLPGTPQDLVTDLLKAAEGSVPFENYDTNKDGKIDHLVIVHAGVDQSGGGGAQGDDAIWAHSSSVLVDSPAIPGTKVDQNYIIQGEDGTIGVFCHEFAHDIGLPDEYDTIYSGNDDTVGFYSLMSSGSWSGKPLGTKPSPISPWGRIALGWATPLTVQYSDITKKGLDVKLDQSTSFGNNNQIVRVNLPVKDVTTVIPYAGTYEYFGGKGDEINTTLSTTIDLTGKTSAVLDFWTCYDIEENWDFGFVQVSEDNGATWKSLSSSRTTSELAAGGYPDIAPNLPGYTGNSGGWVNEAIDLTAYAGKQIKLQFRYMTDWATSLSGFYIDNIRVIADGSVVLDDGAEAEGSWTSDGWTVSQGHEIKNHYYLLEWRNPVNTDVALNYGYNFTNSDAGIVEYFAHDPGLLVWYRDTAYSDNWVGVHPGHGFLGVVDAHSTPIVYKGIAARSRIQVHDAAFNVDRGEDLALTLFGMTKTLQSEQAVPEFNDSQKYWNPKAPSSGMILQTYGLKFRVAGHSADNTVGEVLIYK